jgi:hypothetical protein
LALKITAKSVKCAREVMSWLKAVQNEGRSRIVRGSLIVSLGKVTEGDINVLEREYPNKTKVNNSDDQNHCLNS